MDARFDIRIAEIETKNEIPYSIAVQPACQWRRVLCTEERGGDKQRQKLLRKRFQVSRCCAFAKANY